MNYVDAFVAAVPTSNKKSYLEHAELSGLIFKDHGALSVVECWGDDVPDGEITSLPMAVKCKPDETVVFSWITWPSKEVTVPLYSTLSTSKTRFSTLRKTFSSNGCPPET